MTDNQTHKYTILLLAAGLSRRMGAINKLLLPFQNTSLVHHCAKQINHLNPLEFIAVTGHQPTKIQSELQQLPFRFTQNANYERGMTSSIQQGVSVCSPESKGVLICQSDMPQLTATDLKKIQSAIVKNIDQQEKLIIAPFVGERRGNPIFFSRYYFDALLKHTEPNGCRSLIKANLPHLIKVPLSNENAFEDIDTQEDYDRY